MDRVIAPRDDVARLTPYDVPPPDVPVILSANESPYDLPGPVLARARELVDELAFNRYPDPSARALRDAIGRRFGLSPQSVIVGNGGDELLLDLLLAYGGPGRVALSFPPSFAMYGIECDITGTGLVEIMREKDTFAIPLDDALEELRIDGAAIVVVCTPNNPTGTLAPRGDIASLLEATDAVVLIDEAYMEFAEAELGAVHSVVDLIEEHANLVVLRTFSKAFSLAGLRVGYALGQPATLEPLAKVKLPYNADVFSQAVALAAAENAGLFEERWAEAARERGRLAAALAGNPGTTVFPSSANFLCVRVGDPREPGGSSGFAAAKAALDGAGILVRDVSGYPGLEDCLRVTIGSPEENDAVIAAWPGAAGSSGSRS